MTRPAELRLARWAGWLLLVLVTISLFAPVFHEAVYVGVSDFKWHARAAREWAEGGPVPTAHFLFQTLLITAAPLLPESDWTRDAIRIALACQVALAMVLTALLRQALPPGRPAVRFALAAALAIALMVAAPVNLPTWARHNLYHGYVGLAVYHNPTIVLLKPLAVLVWWEVSRLFAGKPRPVLPLAILTLASTFAKPSHVIALIPAAAALALFRITKRRPLEWKTLAFGLFVPAGLALVWQYAFHFGGGASLAWAPLQAMAYRDASLLGRFLLSALFPLATLALFPGLWRRDSALLLGGVTFLAGTAYAYLLAEADFVSARNFAWSAQAALFVLFVGAVRALAEEAGRGTSRGRLWACGGAFALHVVCGIHYAMNPTWW